MNKIEMVEGVEKVEMAEKAQQRNTQPSKQRSV